MSLDLLPIFVYGTLQRGQERGGVWPHAPSVIEWATTHGELRDLGPYPALLEGRDVVLGELWRFSAEQMPETLAVLDEIEGYDQGGPDLYVRKAITCRTLANETRQAQTYFYARPQEIATAPVVIADADGWRHWARRAPGQT